MPTAEDLLRHGDHCVICQSGDRCAESTKIMRDHLAEVEAGLRKRGRCGVTGNPVGTDTWVEGRTCPCEPCQRYVNA